MTEFRRVLFRSHVFGLAFEFLFFVFVFHAQQKLLLLEKISEYPLANDFENNLELFYSEEISELFYGADEARILKKY